MSLERDTLISFSGADDEPEWIVVNDDVMGGVSRGSVLVNDGQLTFTGTLSLANNGGFASIRTRRLQLDLGNAEALWLRVRGDGRPWELRLASDARVRGSAVSYSAGFETRAGEWIEVRLPLSDFVPTYRGRQLDGPPLDRSRIRELGLLIADGEERSFSVAVDWVQAELRAK